MYEHCTIHVYSNVALMFFKRITARTVHQAHLRVQLLVLTLQQGQPYLLRVLPEPPPLQLESPVLRPQPQRQLEQPGPQLLEQLQQPGPQHGPLVASRGAHRSRESFR